MVREQINRNTPAEYGNSLRSVIDPNDVSGVKNWLIDQIHWQALRGQLSKKGKLLDVGCGIGRMSARIRGQGLEYVGTDSSASMIDAAKAATPDISENFVVSKDGRLPFSGREFNVILTTMVYQYIVGGPDNTSFVGELRRTLRDDGRLIMIEQASLSGQSSGTVSRTTTPDDYAHALYPYFRVEQIAHIRSSHFSRATEKLLSIARRTDFAKPIAMPIATAIEYRKRQLRSDAYLRSIPYFDILLSAAPLPQ